MVELSDGRFQKLNGFLICVDSNPGAERDCPVFGSVSSREVCHDGNMELLERFPQYIPAGIIALIRFAFVKDTEEDSGHRLQFSGKIEVSDHTSR